MAENKTITVAGCQMFQNLGNREANIRTAIEMIQATPGHDIYVLPELSSSGYDESVFNHLEELAEYAPCCFEHTFSGRAIHRTNYRGLAYR